jgi:hypothetical protein
MFAIRNWESHCDLKATKGALELWFTIEIAGPSSGKYPVVVDFIWPSGKSTRVPKTFAIPFNLAQVSQLDIKAHLNNVKAGDYALRLTVAGEQLEDIPFSVRDGPRIERVVLKARVVQTGKLLASVLTQDDMHGDTAFLSFDSIPTELPTELQIAKRFAKLYRNHPEGRNLIELKRASSFPDVVAKDEKTHASVGLELTQLAYEGWQEAQAQARRLNRALLSLLVVYRPRFSARAMILYFNRDGKRPRIPNPASREGRRFLREFQNALERGLWVVRESSGGQSGCRLRLETLRVPDDLPSFHYHLAKVELGPNDPRDPRLTSSDDPLLRLHTSKVIEEGEFSGLVTATLQKKLVKGRDYSSDILLIHNASDPHVLVAAEDDAVEDLATKAVAHTCAGDRFDEVWLFDVWDNSIWRLL